MGRLKENNSYTKFIKVDLNNIHNDYGIIFNKGKEYRHNHPDA